MVITLSPFSQVSWHQLSILYSLFLDALLNSCIDHIYHPFEFSEEAYDLMKKCVRFGEEEPRYNYEFDEKALDEFYEYLKSSEE